MNVLDFGCGTGCCCSLFNPAGYIGIDCDARRIRYAKSRHINYKFMVSSGLRLPVEDCSIDLVLLISVLHHMPTESWPMHFLEFSRVLKADGRVLVFEPCFFKDARAGNLCMRLLDRGKYIQSEDKYLEIFSSCNYKTHIHERSRQLLYYNKLLFTAAPVR